MSNRELSQDVSDLPPRGRLQSHLILSHAAVILLALGLTVLISAVFLRRYERSIGEERLAQLAVPLVAEANVLTFANRGDGDTVRQFPISTLDAQAEAMDIRLLLIDPDGTVRYDTSESDSLRRTDLTQYATTVAAVYQRALRNDGIQYEFIEPPRHDVFEGKQILIAAGTTGLVSPRRVVAIVTDVRRYPLLGLFLPRMLLVAGTSLVAASLVGWWLSRRIAGPIIRLTGAANAMALGKFDQSVESERDDEIGQLVQSFNTMSKRVAASSRAQRELLANVAHELRTPLTSVQGYAQALRDGVVSDPLEQANVLGIIGRESEKMAELIAQLLDLARLESGHSVLARTALPADALVGRIETRFRPIAASKGVILTIHAEPELALLGDESRMIQILANLLDNAIRHTPAEGLVSLAIRLDPTSTDTVRISVHDTGAGIPADQLSGIFDRFQRGDSSLGSSEGGFGLGLSIVRELVERQGGRIEVSSEVGRGSTFTVYMAAA